MIRFWPARAGIVAADATGSVRIYDLATRQVQTTLAVGAVTDLALSPDGRTIVTCGPAGVIVLDSTTRASHKLP